MGTPLRALIVEDSENDAVLLSFALRDGGFDLVFKRVETRDEMSEALKTAQWDIVFADYSLPRFNSVVALTLLQRSGLDIPFIVISGKIGEDVAVLSMKEGAHDYILKNNLTRLVPATLRELREAENRRARKLAEAMLTREKEKFKALFENAPVGIAISTPEGVITDANKALWSMLGYDSGEEFLNVPAAQNYCDAEERTRLRKLHEKTKFVKNFETCLRRKDGGSLMVFSNSAIIVAHDGESRYIKFFTQRE